MEKKGISPLIATVLLIGFTIVLAAVVIRWGGDFINETTETTTCESDLATICATQLNVEIIEASVARGIKVRNNADYDIDYFTVVINDASGSTIDTEELTTIPAPAFEQVLLDTTEPLVVGYTVDVIPTVTTSDASCSGACADNRVTATVVA